MEIIKSNGLAELSVDEMFDLEGGAWWEAAVAAWCLYEVGYAVGKAFAHARNK